MSVADTDLVLLCETWLSDTILDRMIVSNKFRIFRQDRLSRLGGGVRVICRNNEGVVYKRVDMPSRFNRLELVAVDITIGNNNGTRIIVVYYPPDQLTDFNMCQLLISAFMYLSNTNMSICVAGDLNLPRMDWVNNRSPNNDIYIEFSSYFKNNSLVQLVDFPTRGDNVLDVILTDFAANSKYPPTSAHR